MNRKGATVENLYAPIKFMLLVFVFIVLLLFWNVASNITGFWDQSSGVGEAIKSNAQKGIDSFDFMLICFYFAVHIGILIMAYYSNYNPLLLFVSIMLTVILAVIAAPLANVYEDSIRTDTTFATATTEIPMANFIMSKLPYFEVIWSLITMVVLFGLSKGDYG